MLKRIAVLVFIFLCFSFFVQAMPLYEQRNVTVFPLIMSRIQQQLESSVNANLDDAVRASLNTYTDTGAFSDIDYSKTSQTNWEPLTHIVRIYNFALAYTMASSAYYEDEDLYNKIVGGLRFWHIRNPTSTNWWYKQIAEPQRLGATLVQMRKGTLQIPQELEKEILDRMEKDGGNPANQTGANKTDCALHYFYRACLNKNASLLTAAANFTYEPLELVNGEGIQYDYSYQQHGRQLYITGYGDDLLNGVTLISTYTAGTPYMLSGEKLEILRKFILETYSSVIRGQFALFSVGGRGGLSQPGGASKAFTAAYFERMISIDPDNAVSYENAIKRLRGQQPASFGITANHRHYPISDYTVHTRPGYVFDVRMASTRTVRIETMNNENLKTYYASDGSTNIVRRGNEYNGIFGVWNWSKVPGITSIQTPTIPYLGSGYRYGTSAFTGGVSDSLYGVTAYSYDASFSGNSASKAWFFFDDEVVCLGSGVTSASSVSTYDVYTTVNQCLLQGNVTVSLRGNSSVLGSGDHSYPAAPDWILHDGVGYFFPQGGVIGLSNKSQTGNWYEINTSQTNRQVSLNVFSLWFDHGKNVIDGSYAYVVVPNKNNTAEMNEYQQKNAVEILSNNKSIQAVYHRGLDMLGLVFYTGGRFEHEGISVQSDKPCILLFKDTRKTKVTMYIADPAQTEARITILTSFPNVSPGNIRTVCDFSGDAYAGMTRKYEIGSGSAQ